MTQVNDTGLMHNWQKNLFILSYNTLALIKNHETEHLTDQYIKKQKKIYGVPGRFTTLKNYSFGSFKSLLDFEMT